MFQVDVLNFIAAKLQDLNVAWLPSEKKVFFPNENIPEDAYNEEVFFEVFTGGVAPEIDTEQTAVFSTVASIILNGKQNVGVARLETVADAIVNAFSTVSNDNVKTLTSVNNNVKTDVYVTSVERSESAIDGGRYKTTIFLTLDAFERKL